MTLGLDLFRAADGPRPGAAPARRCRRHDWAPASRDGFLTVENACTRCGKWWDPSLSRRSRNNRSRGTEEEE